MDAGTQNGTSFNRDRIIQFVQDTVRLLVDHEDAVSINVISGRNNVIFEVKCHETDVRHLIGKQGATVDSLRQLLNVACRKTGIKYTFEVMEDGA